jgi:hypothetical protein
VTGTAVIRKWVSWKAYFSETTTGCSSNGISQSSQRSHWSQKESET